jgi:hypothetical protein
MIHSASLKNHRIENWQYADAAARTGATGLVAGDIGKLALQLDDSTYWRLTNYSPVTWQLAGPGTVRTSRTSRSSGRGWRGWRGRRSGSGRSSRRKRSKPHSAISLEYRHGVQRSRCR